MPISLYLQNIIDKSSYNSLNDRSITIDVGYVKNIGFKIIEANAFSTSGWYDSHEPSIILNYIKNQCTKHQISNNI